VNEKRRKKFPAARGAGIMGAIIIEEVTGASSRLSAILQAVLVTFLWSTSWVLIKIGLHDNLPPITFAGLRYGLAFLILAPFVLASTNERSALERLTASDWRRLAVLGLIFYTMTQGAQFLSLAYLPAAVVNLLLNFSPLVVGLFGMIWLNEQLVAAQWFGLALCLLGAAIFFLPVSVQEGYGLGMAVALFGVVANAGSSILGRAVNRRRTLSAMTITFVSMGIGSVLLLVFGLATQGLGVISAAGWAIIAWLAMVNTALAFTLWNRTLRWLTAVESSIINGLMLPQTALLAFIFLGEALTETEVAGLVIVAVGVLVVQVRRRAPYVAA